MRGCEIKDEKTYWLFWNRNIERTQIHKHKEDSNKERKKNIRGKQNTTCSQIKG